MWNTKYVVIDDFLEKKHFDFLKTVDFGKIKDKEWKNYANTIIKGETTLIGPIIIGNNCIIEPHTKIGPNVSVGDNSRLSECAVNNSIIMNDCVVEGKINITKSIIAANSNISFLADSRKDKVFLLGEGTRITL